MFGSIVLEVLIGLVLVYLLLSLVCSTIQEAICSLLNWRGKMLRDAIARLFDEPRPSGAPASASTRPPCPTPGGRSPWTTSIYRHPLIDALHKRADRPPSYIPNAAFADALMDRLVRNETMSTPLSPSDRLVGILHALDSGVTPTACLRPSVASALALLMERARQRVDASAPDAVKRTLDAFKEEICAWYENTMNRATGWYRRKSQLAQFLLAAVAVGATNADTVMISEQLATDPKAREAAANAAAKFLEDHQQPPTAAEAADPRAEIKSSIEQLRRTTEEAQIEIGWPDPGLGRWNQEIETVRESRERLGRMRALPTSALVPNATAEEKLAFETKLVESDLQLDAEMDALQEREDKARSSLDWWGSRKLIGLLITICAVALGAPFWFQMLEKLVKLRSSGNPVTGAEVTGSTTPVGEPAAPAGGTAVSVAVGPSGPSGTSVVAVATSGASAAAEKLDERYWTNFVERWKSAGRLALPPSGAADADGVISAFLARMSALAYEPAWTIRGRLAALGVKVDDPDQFKFCDEKGTQAFAFKLGSDVVVAYRGTEPSKIEDITADAHFALSKQLPHAGQVHSGFAEAIGPVFKDLDAWIDEAAGKEGRVFLTGHSLGAALATLHFDRRVSKPEVAVQRHELVTFGSPRVGDSDFCKAFEGRTDSKKGPQRKTRVLRFVNNRDLVTRVAPRSLRFDHVGAEIYIDSDGKVHTGERGYEKWTDFTLLVVDGLVEFKAAAKKPIGDHSMDLYVRRLENWVGWKA